MRQLAQFLGRHHHLVRPPPAEDHDPFDRGFVQHFKRMGDDVAAIELGRGLGQDARDVERDIAHADHHRGLARQVRVEFGELRMAVVPADEGRAAEHVAEVLARQFERAVEAARRSPAPPRRRAPAVRAIVTSLPIGDVADEADVFAERGLLEAAGDALDRLVIGRDAGADQPVGHRQAVEYVDPHVLAERLLRGFGGVISRRAGAMIAICRIALSWDSAPSRKHGRARRQFKQRNGARCL